MHGIKIAQAFTSSSSETDLYKQIVAHGGKIAFLSDFDNLKKKGEKGKKQRFKKEGFFVNSYGTSINY